MDTSKVWYVTGAFQGLGISLVKKLLETGHRVAATSRNAQVLKKSVGLVDVDHFLPMSVDLNSPESLDESIRQTLIAFGRIDVVVNIAGYGMAGTVASGININIGSIDPQIASSIIIELAEKENPLLFLQIMNSCQLLRQHPQKPLVLPAAGCGLYHR